MTGLVMWLKTMKFTAQKGIKEWRFPSGDIHSPKMPVSYGNDFVDVVATCDRIASFPN
jgi:hypothetical protein